MEICDRVDTLFNIQKWPWYNFMILWILNEFYQKNPSFLYIDIISKNQGVFMFDNSYILCKFTDEHTIHFTNYAFVITQWGHNEFTRVGLITHSVMLL